MMYKSADGGAHFGAARVVAPVVGSPASSTRRSGAP